MKGKLFGLMAIAAWLNVSPASAITYYDYHVDFTISPNRGGPAIEITGSVQTNCDVCVLNSANYVTSWSLKGSDGSSIGSSEPTAEIIISVPGPTNILQATPTGIYTLTNPSSGGYFELCGDANNCLSISNYFHTIQPYPVFELDWIEQGNTTNYDYRTPFSNQRPDFTGPVVQLATLADTLECTGNSCVSIPAPVPEPSTWAMLMLGLAGLGFMVYRRNAKPAGRAA